MKVIIDEKASAYLDGEASPEEVENTTAALLRDPTLRDALSRQHWLRHALRDSRPLVLDAGFSARVLAGLDAEQEVTSAPRTNVIPLQSRKTAVPRWRRQTTGLAVAASLVGAVVLINNPLGDEPSVSADAVVPALASQQQAATMSTPIQQVALQQQQPQPQARVAADHWTVSDPDLQNRLNGYLLEHDGLARGYGFSGATPSLVRAATYTQVSER